MRTRHRQRGAIAMLVLVVVLTVFLMGFVLFQSSVATVGRVERRAEDVRLEAVGEAVVDLAMRNLWDRFGATVGTDTSTLDDLRTFLDAEGIGAQALASGSTGDFDILGRGVERGASWADLLATTGLPKDKKGHAVFDGARVHVLEILRQDGEQVTAFRVRARVSFGSDDGRHDFLDSERLYLAGGPPFEGMDFALLANNVNCIMCHASVDSAPRYYNADPSRYGSFRRVRVGTLESLKIRAGSCQSSIAGALYTRGPIMDKSGTLLTSLAGTSLNSCLFDEDWKLAQSSTGSMTPTTFYNATGDPLPKAENLYQNYPLNPDDQTDGPLPSSFPPVIPDANHNRVVDESEFADAAKHANGSITGGLKEVVAPGGTYPEMGLPAYDQVAKLQGTISGHVVLEGTPANPLVLDGNVAVDGDLVLSGTVRGSGEILARNNVYVVGSVRYQDGVDAGGYRTFGVAADGTENRLTLASGGSVLIGDFLTGKKSADGVSGDPSGDFNFVLAELMLFNQMEWTHAQAQIMASTGGKTLTLVDNPLYRPGYVPRYYVMRAENPVAIYNKNKTYFSTATCTWLGSEHAGSWDDSSTTYLYPGDAARTASTVVTLVPEGGWLSAEQLISMWDQTASMHTGGPFAVDAFVYTNNAVTLVPGKSSAYGGQALINGGLVGADMAILVPGGLQLNFDDRHKGKVSLREDTGQVTLQRGVRLK